MQGCRKFCWPRLCLILGLTKSFRATAANAFSPLLIVLSRFVVQEVISKYDFRNLREPEKTPAIKSPGRPGIAPATSRTMNGTNWSWRNGLMLIILKKIFVYWPVFWLFLLWEGRSQHRLHTKRGPAIRPTQPRIWFQIMTILTRNPIIQLTLFWR